MFLSLFIQNSHSVSSKGGDTKIFFLMAEFNNQNDGLKCIIIGDSGVGKSSITKRLVENSFSETTQSTVGVEYDFTNITVNGKSENLYIWDTAGQEKFRSIARAYYRNASCALLVFDMTNKETFNNINTWLSDVNSLCENVSIILVGNKSDLASDRAVSTEEAQSFADLNKIPYIETSAKDGTNISEAFIKCASEVRQRSDTLKQQQNVNIQEATPQQKKGCC